MKYQLTIFAPHPFVPGTGGVTALGKSKDSRFEHEISRLVHKYKIGMSVHNGSFDSIRDSVVGEKYFGITLPKIKHTENISHTPKDMLEQANPTFYAGGADAHTVSNLGTVLYIECKGPVTYENVFESMISNKKNSIFRPERSLLEKCQHFFGGIKQFFITVDELRTEAKLKKEIGQN